MSYGVDASPFYALDTQLRELPETIPVEPGALEGVLFAYLRAFDCLLALVMAIMRACVRERLSPADEDRWEDRSYVRHFFPVYEQAARRILELLELEIREGTSQGSENVVELVYAIRDGQTGPELIALDRALSESEGEIEPEEHLETATTVTNSLKQQIEKHTKRKWIHSVLHALNEVISIGRGVA